MGSAHCSSTDEFSFADTGKGESIMSLIVLVQKDCESQFNLVDFLKFYLGKVPSL